MIVYNFSHVQLFKFVSVNKTGIMLNLRKSKRGTGKTVSETQMRGLCIRGI